MKHKLKYQLSYMSGQDGKYGDREIQVSSHNLYGQLNSFVETALIHVSIQNSLLEVTQFHWDHIFIFLTLSPFVVVPS